MLGMITKSFSTMFSALSKGNFYFQDKILSAKYNLQKLSIRESLMFCYLKDVKNKMKSILTYTVTGQYCTSVIGGLAKWTWFTDMLYSTGSVGTSLTFRTETQSISLCSITTWSYKKYTSKKRCFVIQMAWCHKSIVLDHATTAVIWVPI